MTTQLTLSRIYSTTNNLHLLGFCLLFITACSVFKEKSFYQADSLLRRNTRTEVKTEVQTQTQGFRIYTSDDSTDKQSYTEIFPEGIFSYSVKEGFQGKAGRVVINERVKGGKQVRSSAGVIETSKLREELKETEKVIKRNQLKDKRVDANNFKLFYMAGVVLIFAMIYIYRRFLKGRVLKYASFR